jgi:hypothetical protein
LTAGFRAAALVVVEVEVVRNSCSKFVDGREGVPAEVLVLEDRPEALGLRPDSTVKLEATVPAGRHKIELSYWPTRLTLGLGATAVALIALVAWVLIDVVRHHRRESRSSVPDRS